MAEFESERKIPANAEVRHFTAQRQEHDKQAEPWRKDAKDYFTRYRNMDGDQRKARRYNVFFANTEILQAATMNKVPQPDVSRRWQSPGPIQQLAQQASQVLEKVLRMGADDNRRFEMPLEQANQDALVGGLGQVRVPVENETVTFDDGTQKLQDQRAPLKYVYWDSFRWQPARTWDDVQWIEYEHLMTRDDMKDNPATSAKASEIPLTVTVSARNMSAPIEDKSRAEPPSTIGRARIWERWDRRSGKRIWLAEDWPDVLLKEDPPARFDHFFDCPEPLVYNKTNDIFMPIPDFNNYRDQALELDNLTMRMDGLISMIKAAGLYDQNIKEFPDLADMMDGVLIPVDLGAAGIAKLQDLILFWPIENAIAALRECQVQREAVKATIDALTGISDVIRGQTDPNETLGAQNLKAQFGSFRLSGKKNTMRRFVEAGFNLQGEVAAEVFTPETLTKMTGEEISEDLEEFLRDDQMRGNRVDVSLDEMVRPDQEAAKASAVEYGTAMTSYFETAVPLVTNVPTLAPIIANIGKFISRQFKVGREMEEQFDQAMDALAQQAQQPKGEPQPEPDTVLKSETTLEQERMKQEGEDRRTLAEAAVKMGTAPVATPSNGSAE